MNRRDDKELKNLLSPDSHIDFYYWISLLNFFDNHKEELNIKELKKIVDKCEECRLYLNENNNDPIGQQDVNPNIYEYYRLLIKNNKEMYDFEFNNQIVLNVS